MATWPVLDADDHRLFTWTIPGANRRITIRRDAPGFILMWMILRFNDLVERLDGRGGDPVDEGGYNKRYISGTTRWSDHARALAADLNWTKNRYGVKASRVFTKAQIDMIHRSMRMVNVVAGGKLLEWGGDWPSHAGSTAKPDPMHFQVNRMSNAAIKRTALWASKTKRGKAIIKANPKNTDYRKVM